MKAAPSHLRKTLGLSAENGFSLIELLAALVLAGVLMMTTGKLLNILRQQEKLIARTAEADAAWVSRTLDLLEQDLQNSRRVRATPSGFQLSGFAGTDRITGQANQSEGLVEWSIEEQPGTSWLIRTESASTSLSNRPSQRKVVAADVRQISLWFTDAPDVSFFSDGASGPQFSPLPASIICQLSLQTETANKQHRRTVLLRP